MLSAAHSQSRQAPANLTADSVPIARALPESPVRELASRLNDINVKVTPATYLPKHFGRGALFWRADSMQAPPNLRRIFLPSDKDANEFAQLTEKYGDAASGAYKRARNFAEPFAHLERGVAQLETHFNPHKLAEIRSQLTQALKQDTKFAEAWILLARTLGRSENSITLEGKALPAKFIQSMAAVMANPYDPNLVMQLMAALPAQEELPEFLKQTRPAGHSLPLSQARLALYTLRHLNPGHAGAMSALIESGESIKLNQLMPVRGEAGKTELTQAELGALAMVQYDWQTGFLALRHSREEEAGDNAVFTLGGGSLVTAEQLETLIKLETEERDPNAGPSFDRESGQSLLDRDRARAELLDELADSLDGPDSWFYVPDYMLMNQQQLKAMAGVFRAEAGAFDRLARTLSAPIAASASANDPAADTDTASDGSDHSDSDVSLGDVSMVDAARPGALMTDTASSQPINADTAPVTAERPIPIYRNTAITPEWVSAHHKLVEGRADPALFRQLAAQAQESPLGFVSVLGQAYRARDLELRADLLADKQKPASEQSAVPVFRLYLDQAKELANNTVRNPAPIKQRPFVLKLSNQRGHPLVDLLTTHLPITWGQKTLERDLTDALKSFMRQFDESRTSPFRALSDEDRRSDGDFKRALSVVDLMAQMPERLQALQTSYAEKRAEAERLAAEKDLTIPQAVTEMRFPDAPVYTSPDRCTCCLESEETEENPLLTIPFDPGAHRECMAEQMIVQGRPDLKGAWNEAPALSFIEWTDQANQAIKGYSDFIRTHQSPPPPPPPANRPITAVESDDESDLASLSLSDIDDSDMTERDVNDAQDDAARHQPPPMPLRAPMVRETVMRAPSPPLEADASDQWDVDAIDQWLADNFGPAPDNGGRISVSWGDDDSDALTEPAPSRDLEAPSDEMPLDDAQRSASGWESLESVSLTDERSVSGDSDDEDSGARRSAASARE